MGVCLWEGGTCILLHSMNLRADVGVGWFPKLSLVPTFSGRRHVQIDARTVKGDGSMGIRLAS